MDNKSVSNAFMTFMKEAQGHSKIWGEMVQQLDSVSALDKKTEELSYIAVLAAARLESGILFHVKMA